ncbi:MAG TPA: ASKHA domain-containing protein [Lachnospiraceae bacterium]|nr:ASKHA domain-containing protein [Lachnospiraceae bacterium]
MKITFQPMNHIIEEANEVNLLEIARKHGIQIEADCAGAGICGKCRVKVIEGSLNDPTDSERAVLSDVELADGVRLSCEIVVQNDMVVEIPKKQVEVSRKKDMMKLPAGFKVSPRIRKVFLEIPEPNIENPSSDLERLLSCLSEKSIEIESGILPKLHATLKEKRGKVTAIITGGRIIGLEAGDTTSVRYGIAFDIGTTTVVGMLWDLDNGTLLDVEGRTNPQSAYGADVISRIQYSMRSTENLNTMRDSIIDCMNEMIEEFTTRGIFSGRELGSTAKCSIYAVTLAGNTTMSHLALGVTPESLSKSPFSPVFCKSIQLTGIQSGLHVNPYALVHVLPNIAGHVGSDIVSVMLTTNLRELDGANLAIDIGTNGEILLAHQGKVLTCSTAAGPAFEGASIYQGMRAAKGAIEEVEITMGTVECKVIEGGEATGICGSGLIDAIAQMLEVGVIDETGRLLEEQEALEAGISEGIAKRLVRSEKGLEFILVYRQTDPIVITQKDIREVQLAKGSIAAGMKTLMKIADLMENDITRIMIAGAFGNYIRKESALRIGLLPLVDVERVISVGNAAGAGASMALLSEEASKLADTLARQVEHIELSTSMQFQEEFLNNLNF